MMAPAQHLSAGCRHPQQYQALVSSHRQRLLSTQPPQPPRAAAAAAATAQPAEHGDWRQLLIQKSLQPGQLVKLTVKGKLKGDAGLLANIKEGSSASSSAAAATAAAGGNDDGSLCSGVAPGTMPYKQLTMRPVLIKGKRLLQVSVLTARQDITKNYSDSQAAAELGQLLQLPWSSAALLTATESMAVQVSRKGKAQVQVTPSSKPQQQQQPAQQQSTRSVSDSAQQPTAQQQQQSQVPELFGVGSTQQQPDPQQQVQQPLISLQHDRVKATPINGSTADPFLHKIGLQTAEGKIKANMQSKFTQINEFLKLLVHTGELEQLGNTSSSSSSSSSRAPVHVLDAGCGSSHLTFGTYHYLHNVMGLPVRLTGVDTNRALMQRSNRACAELGIADVATFHTAAIKEFSSLGLPQPDMVLALHACDTATDEALAVGVLSGARIIMSVPCCQKDIQRQFQRLQQQQQQDDVQQVWQPLLDHGILKQRQLDLLTDAFRAQLLRLAGYRTDVVEFVSTEHTPRNLLIRAVRRRKPLAPGEAEKLAQQYVQLRDAWGVRPHLERLLLDSLPPQAAALLRSK